MIYEEYQALANYGEKEEPEVFAPMLDDYEDQEVMPHEEFQACMCTSIG